jgi:hypothetical protein
MTACSEYRPSRKTWRVWSFKPTTISTVSFSSLNYCSSQSSDGSTALKKKLENSEQDLELERRKYRDLYETHKEDRKLYSDLKVPLYYSESRSVLSV